MRWIFVAPALLTAMLAGESIAQQSGTGSEPVPQIVTSGRGETQVTPDRARIDVAVETRGPTAAAAAMENARIAQIVLARVKALGITDQQLSTWGYNVNPEYEYRGDGRPRIIGYVARNTVRTDIRRLDQVGPVIDAAIAAGANNISGLDFYSSDISAARQSALADAVAQARADAEVMARAAGGRLGPLLELSSSFMAPPPNYPMLARGEMMAAQADMTPVSPGERTVTATVNARWRFIAP